MFIELIERQVLQRRKHFKLILGHAIDDATLLGADRTITADRLIWIERRLELDFTAMTRSLVGSIHHNPLIHRVRTSRTRDRADLAADATSVRRADAIAL